MTTTPPSPFLPPPPDPDPVLDPVPLPPGSVPVPAPVTPERTTHEKTARLAFQIWEDNGKQPGTAVDNWLAAEKILAALGEL